MGPPVMRNSPPTLRRDDALVRRYALPFAYV